MELVSYEWIQGVTASGRVSRYCQQQPGRTCVQGGWGERI